MKKIEIWKQKPTAREIRLTKDGDFVLAVQEMTHRLKLRHPAHAITMLQKYKTVRIPLPIEGLELSGDSEGQVEVKVKVDGRWFVAIQQQYCKGGIMSDSVTPSFIRSIIHRDIDGCDERIVVSRDKKRLKVIPCTKRKSCF